MHILTKTISICFLLIPALVLLANNPLSPETGSPKVGDVLIIDAPKASNYLYIEFPKPNIILKRSGVYSIDSVRGVAVEITMVKERKDGSFLVKLQPMDGKKFFRYWQSVMAHYDKAVASGELRKKSE